MSCAYWIEEWVGATWERNEARDWARILFREWKKLVQENACMEMELEARNEIVVRLQAQGNVWANEVTALKERRCVTCKSDKVNSWRCGALAGRPQNRPGGIEAMRGMFSCSEWEPKS